MADEQASNPTPDKPAADSVESDVSQAEIDAVMAAMDEAGKDAASLAELTAAAAGEAPAAPSAEDMSIEELLKAASFEDATNVSAAPAAAPAQQFDLPNFQEVLQDAAVSSIDLLRDVELN